MGWDLFARSDDRFISQVKIQTKRTKLLEQLINARSIFTIAVVFFALLAFLIGLVTRTEFTPVHSLFFALAFSIILITDCQIKMIKLFSSTQQERDSNTPKTD